MTQCNTLNIKLSNSQFNKFKSGIKNGTEVTLNLSSNVIGDSNDDTIFPNKLLLTDTIVIRKRNSLETPRNRVVILDHTIVLISGFEFRTGDPLNLHTFKKQHREQGKIICMRKIWKYLLT